MLVKWAKEGCCREAEETRIKGVLPSVVHEEALLPQASRDASVIRGNNKSRLGSLLCISSRLTVGISTSSVSVRDSPDDSKAYWLRLSLCGAAYGLDMIERE